MTAVIAEAETDVHDLGRLAILDEPDWAAMHEHVQEILSDLDRPVRDRFPEVEIRPWFAPAPASPFLSYRAFRWPDRPDLEAVVVVVSYCRSNGRMVLMSDIAGEESGKVFFDSGDRPINEDDLVDLSDRVDDAARELRRHPDAVLAGLINARSDE
jgi:hypothetical protein